MFLGRLPNVVRLFDPGFVDPDLDLGFVAPGFFDPDLDLDFDPDLDLVNLFGLDPVTPMYSILGKLYPLLPNA